MPVAVEGRHSTRGEAWAVPDVAPQGGPTVPQTTQKAVWELACSVLGFVIFPVILHVAGLLLANQSLSDRGLPGSAGRRGMAKAARILSIVGLVLAARGLVIWLLIAVVAVPQS